MRLRNRRNPVCAARLAAGVVLTAAAVFVTSCIGIDSTVVFKKDGSGVLHLEYRVSRELTDLGGIEADLPLALSEEDFRFAVESGNGVELRKYSRRIDDANVTVTAQIAFRSVDALSNVQGFRGMPMSLESEDGVMVFRQEFVKARFQEAHASEPGVPSEARRSDVGLPEQELLAPLFQGYAFSFTVTAPSKITDHNVGELSKDGRSVTYSLSLEELNAQAEDLTLICKWRI